MSDIFDTIPSTVEIIIAGKIKTKIKFPINCIANRIIGCVNAPSLIQRALIECVDEKVDLSTYNENRNLLYNELKKYGFECIKPQGAFYLFLKAPIEDDVEFCNKAKEYNILFVPGSSFACKGYVRIAYCVSTDMIKRALPAFKKLADYYEL